MKARQIIDAHAYQDESRLRVADYPTLLDRYGIDRAILSPACTHDHEPDKPALMYWIQRQCLSHPPSRYFVEKVSTSFYDGQGHLRPFWRLFTRKQRPLKKVLRPANDELLAAIRPLFPRLQMWWWINPAFAPAPEALSAALSRKEVAGLKLHAYWHGFRTEEATPLLDLSRRVGKPVYFILGFAGSGNYRYLVDRHRDDNFIFGYGGFPYFKTLWKAIRELPNFRIDLASNHLDRRIIQEAIDYLGPERCLFATDCPYNFADFHGCFDYAPLIARVKSAALDDDDRDYLFWKNFAEISESPLLARENREAGSVGDTTPAPSDSPAPALH